MNIKCLIIDDEPSSQNVLKKFINTIDFLELKNTCNSALEASEFLKTNSVDLLFLDINMPKLSGIEFYKSLKNRPEVIFTTAYSEYALDGFDLNAVDYLLKPFSFERFLQATNKTKDIFANKTTQEHFIIKADKKLHQVAFKDILVIEAFGDYIKLHLVNKTLVTHLTLSKAMNLLPVKNFIQVHKSFVINAQHLNFIEGNQITIQAHKIPIGQKYKPNFLLKIKS